MKILQKLLNIKKVFQVPITIFLAILIVVFTIGSPYFFSFTNFYNIVIKASTIGMLALGLAFVIMNGNIDLSVGSLLGLTSAVFVISYNHYSLPIAILLTVLVGFGIGLWNGFCVSVLKIASFIVTLGSMIGVKGLTFALTKENSVNLTNFGFTDLSITNFLGISVIGWIYGGIALLLLFVHRYTVHGRNVLFVGGNIRAARAAGINTKLHQMINFVICSITVSLAAIVLTSQLGAATPNTGRGYELWAIASVAIGGVRLIGGVGKIPLVFLGGITIAVLRNGMNLMHISTAYIYITTGMVLLIVMAIDQYLDRIQFYAEEFKQKFLQKKEIGNENA